MIGSDFEFVVMCSCCVLVCSIVFVADDCWMCEMYAC